MEVIVVFLCAEKIMPAKLGYNLYPQSPPLIDFIVPSEISLRKVEVSEVGGDL